MQEQSIIGLQLRALDIHIMNTTQLSLGGGSIQGLGSSLMRLVSGPKP